MNKLQEFKDKLAIALYGQTATEAQSTGLCIQCKQTALDNCYSEAGRREYTISGLCEKCFDSIYTEPEATEDDYDDEPPW